MKTKTIITRIFILFFINYAIITFINTHYTYNIYNIRGFTSALALSLSGLLYSKFTWMGKYENDVQRKIYSVLHIIIIDLILFSLYFIIFPDVGYEEHIVSYIYLILLIITVTTSIPAFLLSLLLIIIVDVYRRIFDLIDYQKEE